ncbi:MAG TPA: DJ-1/PfpI family protein [Xanthobacteraceae bacterium]|nr:DJ-1/PfpI family protein [Xanthobacteraceae bacterium]
MRFCCLVGQLILTACGSSPRLSRSLRHSFDAEKPVAAICHGPWTIINAGAARGRQMTSWPSLEMDLGNAGAKWADEEAVTDQGLVTSRRPDDIPPYPRRGADSVMATGCGSRQ